MSAWTQTEAIELCRQVEQICPAFNCHVALTGGLLYKQGSRKDCDILFYSIRGREIDKDGLRMALIEIGFDTFMDYGFVQKTRFKGKRVDVFFPEHPVSTDQDYDKRTEKDPDQARDEAIEQRRIDAMFAPIEDDCL